MKINQFKIRSLFAISAFAFVLGLSGCTSVATKRVNSDYNSAVKIAQSRAISGRTMIAPSSAFTVENGFYIDKKPIAVTLIDTSHELPPLFKDKSETLDIQTPTPLTDIAARITRSTGLTVSIAQDVLDNDAGKLGQVVKSGATGAGAGGSSSGSNNSQPIMVDEIIYHNGNLAGLMDNLTAKLGLSWRWNGTGIEIFRYETKTYSLDALAGISSLNAKINTASSTLGSGGGGGTTSSSNTSATTGQNTDVHNTSDIWSEVTATIQGMLSPNGRVIVTPTSATITVRDTPQVLRQVGVEIAQLNRIYNKQVALDVEVYSVQRSDTSNAGFDWNLAFANAAHKVGLNYTTTGNNGTAGSPLGNAFKISATGGPFQGSSLTLAALSALGKTTLVTSGQAISLNGQSVPLNVSREQAYLQSQTTTLSGGTSSGLASTQLTPGLVTEGFSMNFTPLVTSSGDVLMRYTIDLSTIDGITTYTTPDGSASIQLPEREVRNFMQNVRVHSGETLVLTGFQQNSGSDKEQGVGKSNMWALGGGRQATALNKTLVVVVTPYILGR